MSAWGDIPTWIQAIANSVALLATAALLYIESGRRRDERNDARAKQANQVSLQLVRFSDSGKAVARITNNSQGPIYNATFRLSVNHEFVNDFDEIVMIPPGVDQDAQVLNDRLTSSTVDVSSDSLIDLDFLFTDTSQVRWARSLGGVLVSRVVSLFTVRGAGQ